MRICFALLTLIFSACITDTDLPYPEGEKQVVVNGILHPDNVINVNLTKTKPVGASGSFEIIENADIQLLENGIYLETLNYKGNGNYLAINKAREGQRYKIIATVPGFEKAIEAEDIVPPLPSFLACYSKTNQQSTTAALFDVSVFVKISNSLPSTHHPWIELISKDYNYDYRGDDTTKLIVRKFFSINSNSPYLDNFNASFDYTFGFFDYSHFLRLSEPFGDSPDALIEILGGSATQTSRLFRYETITQLKKDQALEVHVINCSNAYDKYLKSTLLNYLNTEFVDASTLFSGPVKVFSNVKNGTGIFAAYTSNVVRVDSFKCQ